MKLKISSTAIINLVLVLALLGGMGYSGYAGWRIMHGEEIVTPFIGGGSVSATPAPVPDLKLNVVHQRQGETIQVQPDTLGRDNPFSIP